MVRYGASCVSLLQPRHISTRNLPVGSCFKKKAQITKRVLYLLCTQCFTPLGSNRELNMEMLTITYPFHGRATFNLWFWRKSIFSFAALLNETMQNYTFPFEFD